MSFKTVHTLLVRLIEKGHAEIEEEGRRPTQFLPRVTREEAVTAATRTFAAEYLGDEPESLRIAERFLSERRKEARRETAGPSPGRRRGSRS